MKIRITVTAMFLSFLLLASCVADKDFDFGKTVAESIGVKEYTVGVDDILENKIKYSVYRLELGSLPDTTKDVSFDDVISYSAFEIVKIVDPNRNNLSDSIKVSVRDGNMLSEKTFSFFEINRLRLYLQNLKSFTKWKGDEFYTYFDTTYVDGEFLDKFIAGEQALTDTIDNVYFKGFEFIATPVDKKSVTKIWFERENGTRNLLYRFDIADSIGKIVACERKLL